jgi:predicted phage-related endonuclease
MQMLPIEQGSDEWMASRCGIVTMSNLQCLLANGKDASGFGVQALGYMNELIGERITGEPSAGWAGNSHTLRGHEMEPVARDLYQEITGSAIEPVGIILNHGVGFSPDGLVDEDGVLEIKSKLAKLQVEVILSGEIPKEHIAQVQGGLWVSEREWLDFVSYWPGMPLFVKRAYRDEAYIRDISRRVEKFYDELENRISRIIAE